MVDHLPPSAENLCNRLDLETLISDLASRFINLSPGEVDRQIESTLRLVCEFLGIDVAVVLQRTASAPDVLMATHAYPAREDPARARALQEHYRWSAQQLLAGRTIALASLDDPPPETAVDVEVARLAGIKSSLCLPFSVGGAPVGALVFNTVQTERDWPEVLVKRLRVLAQVFADALARKRADEALRKTEPHCLVGVSIDITERKRDEDALRVSQVRLAQGADLAGLGFYEVDLAGQSVYVDDRFRALVGLPPDREAGLQPLEFWMAHLHPDDRQRVMDVREQLHAGNVEKPTIEYRYCHPTHGTIWLLHTSRVTVREPAGRATKNVGVIRDITTRKQAEESLRQSYAEIEKLKDRLQAESDYLKAEIRVARANSELAGESAAIQKVLRLVEQVAPTGSSVLVRGETGSGKELVAQAIHRLSPRGNRLMVKVNCAALPSGLVDNELFGREKGAFTGALTRQAGRFEVADGSTLFLDEIGELSLDLQAKLLRVLESGEFERLGSSRTIKVDARLVAATNRDLSEAIKQGRFREDLYYRLNVFPIRMPSLRDRREDIPLLVWTFLDEFCLRMGKKITQIPRQAMEALQRHSWPGNVRELRNQIERAVILTTGDTLRLPTLDDATPATASPQTLADAEREHILRALERAGWHVKGSTGAATQLGLPPGTLYGRMRRLGIPLHPPTANGS